jgi:Cu/Ag efflux pump CusA
LVIIGGLLSSTLLTLIVVPVLYKVLTPEPAASS